MSMDSLPVARRIVDAFDVPRGLIGLVEVEDVEHDEANHARWRREWELDLAWRRWRLDSCVEFNGGHDIRLRIAYGEWSIICDHGCPLDLDDIYPDGRDVTHGDIPVDVRAWSEKVRENTPMGPAEWDGGVDIAARGADR